MNVRRWIGPSLLLLGLVCLTTTGHGQDIKMKPFTSKEKSFYQTVQTVTTQDLKVLDMTLKQKQDQTFLMKWTKEPEKDGKLIITQEIIGVKMDMDIGGNKISYDSEKDANTKNPMTLFFGALLKSKFTLTVNPKNYKVEKVEGLSGLVSELAKVNKTFENALKAILTDEAGKTLAEPIFAMVPPDGAIDTKKPSWTAEPVVLKMGGLGTYTTKNTYKYVGEDKKDKNLIEIEVTPKLEYEPPAKGDAKDKDTGLPFKIKGGELKTQKASGTIWWNKELDRVEKSELKVNITGKLDVSIASSDTEVGLTQEQVLTVQSFADNPWKKKDDKGK